MNEKRFCLVREEYRIIIRDVEHGLNFLFLAESGPGPTTDSIELAERVVEFLNSLPPEETLMYPYEKR
jgi:hypothetical protein